MRKGPLFVVTAAVGLLATGYAIRRLLENPEIRAKLQDLRDELRERLRDNDNVIVDRASEESFPASDSPAYR